MNADEIAKALRAYARNAQENNEFYPMQDFDAAADVIEHLNDFEHSQCAKLLAHIAELEAQLAESQRRERAAVEDILVAHSEGRCAVCKHKAVEVGASCKKWPDRSCFEWRGPQEAGKERQ